MCLRKVTLSGSVIFVSASYTITLSSFTLNLVATTPHFPDSELLEGRDRTILTFLNFMHPKQTCLLEGTA